MADTSILNLIIDAAIDKLVEDLSTNISDETKAGLIRDGRLQDDPTQYGITVLAYPNDPYDETWIHTVAKGKEHNLLGLDVPPYEIGGGEMWWRRFTAQLVMFFEPDVNRHEARMRAMVVLSRAEWSLSNLSIGDLGDTFGERGHKVFVVRSYTRHSGGTGTYIWKGMVNFVALTSKEYP